MARNNEHCAACGKSLAQRRRVVAFSNVAAGIDARFCNADCKNRFMILLRTGEDQDAGGATKRRRPARYTPRLAPIACAVCGIEFMPRSGRQQFCPSHARKITAMLSAVDEARLVQIASALSVSRLAALSIMIETHWDELRASGDIPDEVEEGAMPA